jgi:hypothetical protein
MLWVIIGSGRCLFFPWLGIYNCSLGARAYSNWINCSGKMIVEPFQPAITGRKVVPEGKDLSRKTLKK